MNSISTCNDKTLILIVDDDSMTRIMMRQVLAKEGFAVLDAENGQIAVDIFKSQQPECIIMDIEMPIMDGLTACSTIRKEQNGDLVPILISTGFDDVKSIENAYQAGATDFISKPVNWTVFGHRIRYILRASEAIADYQRAEKHASRLGRIVENSSNEIFIIDSETFLIQEANSNARENLKLSNQASEQHFLPDFLVDISIDELTAQVTPLLEEKCDEVAINAQIKRTDHSYYQLEMRIHLFDQEKKSQFVIIAQDITDRAAAEERMRQMAFYDGLTGLPNRQLFIETLNMMIKLSQRCERLVALMFIDLDNFKRVNDTLGHSYGDLLLKHVAERLKSCVRESDYIARYVDSDCEMMAARLGGDEFTVVLNNLKDTKGAEIVAERILTVLGDPVELDDHSIAITPSIGIAFAPIDTNDVTALLEFADTAMYHAKNNGKNNYQFYSFINQMQCKAINGY